MTRRGVDDIDDGADQRVALDVVVVSVAVVHAELMRHHGPWIMKYVKYIIYND